jgi:hypothetical protein
MLNWLVPDDGWLLLEAWITCSRVLLHNAYSYL